MVCVKWKPQHLVFYMHLGVFKAAIPQKRCGQPPEGALEADSAAASSGGLQENGWGGSAEFRPKGAHPGKLILSRTRGGQPTARGRRRTQRRQRKRASPEARGGRSLQPSHPIRGAYARQPGGTRRRNGANPVEGCGRGGKGGTGMLTMAFVRRHSSHGALCTARTTGILRRPRRSEAR
jgi:hypothetical protein